MSIKAIETSYRGYRFRSRLEARWAVFFDACGINWEYEPEGFQLPSGPYLPDFYVWKDDYDGGWYLEIKPNEAAVTERTKKCREELHNLVGWRTCAIVVGVPDYGECNDGNIAGVLAGFLGDESRLNEAVDAARSARFEHGESGGR